jgi:hypothetical protein
VAGGEARFEYLSIAELAPTGLMRDAHAGDFSGDGVPDVLAVVPATPARLDVFLNRGSGAFEPFQSISLSSPAGGVTLADSDRDGLPDAIVCMEGGVYAFVQQAAGGFSKTPRLLASHPSPCILRAAAISGDSFPDLVIAHASSGVGWLRANATAATGFSPFVSLTPSFNGVMNALEVGRVNSDTSDDIVIAFDVSSRSGVVAVSTSVGGAASNNFATIASYVDCNSLAVCNFRVDGLSDGFRDVLVGCADSAYAILGEGEGKFNSTPLVIKTAKVNFTVSCADIDSVSCGAPHIYIYIPLFLSLTRARRTATSTPCSASSIRAASRGSSGSRAATRPSSSRPRTDCSPARSRRRRCCARATWTATRRQTCWRWARRARWVGSGIWVSMGSSGAWRARARASRPTLPWASSLAVSDAPRNRARVLRPHSLRADSLFDIVVGSCRSQVVALLTQTSEFVFSRQPVISDIGCVQRVLASQFNADPAVDLAVVSDTGLMRLYAGDGRGGFLLSFVFTLGWPLEFYAADVGGLSRGALPTPV